MALKTFAEFLLEDAVGATNVGGGNIAGLGVGKDGEPGVDLPRRRKNHRAQAYSAAVRLAQFRIDQQDNTPHRRPNRYRHMLEQARTPPRSLQEMMPPASTLGMLFREEQFCGAEKLCWRCTGRGVCLLSLPIMGLAQ
jgi:hypothetical protein